jgi:Mycothiol maleylpyruvate isomerase N-terminal domain
MSRIRSRFLETAPIALRLLEAPAVAEGWSRPSALSKWSVGGLATHLVMQIWFLREVLEAPPATQQPVPVLGHYERSRWLDTGLDSEANTFLRDAAEREAAVGHEGVCARSRQALDAVHQLLPNAPNKPVRLPFWGDWSLSVDDFTTTRTLEISVHVDDLAVSVGLPTPELPVESVEIVVDVLSRLAIRRHGQVNVIRALSRAERATSIAAM